jgi:hypothetical protein
MTTSFGAINKIELEGYERKLFHVLNVTINSESLGDLHTIEGNAFMYNTFNWQYGHVMQDVIGQYEIIRKKIPDLKFAVIISIDEFGKPEFANSVIESVVNHYPDSILIHPSQKTTFKNLYYIYNRFMNILDDIESNTETSVVDSDFHSQLDAVKIVKAKFKPKKHKHPIRKLYISRKIADKMYENPGMEHYKEMRTLKNQHILEEYMISIGYEVVYNEGMSLEEQAELYESASHIVTINGTGAYNSIFCNLDTKIVLLNIHTRFSWFFDTLIREVGIKDVITIPEFTNKTGLNYPILAEQLVECLKSIEDRL